jgi:acyl carrier protein
MTTQERVRQFIVQEVAPEGGKDQLTDDLPLIENNLIDSLGIFHIVSFLEREFDVEVLDEELIPEHFGTIGSIARLVESKRERA